MLVEAAAGYPGWLFRRAGHPVSWAGWLIERMDAEWNDARAPASFVHRRGIAALGGVAGVAWMAGRVVSRHGRIAVVVATSSLLAARSLHAHVAAVSHGLEDGLPAGRAALSMIVGRDTAQLDEAAVARAAIESLAENFSDAVVAPALWFVIGGLPAMAAYKAINTADSMIGHRTERHRLFGWASARTDDWVNLPASRLSALLIALASGQPRPALRAVRRSAARHRSPNAGWPEAAMAGALGIRLAGPRSYRGHPVEDAWMGEGPADPGRPEIARALRVYRRACVLAFAITAWGGVR